MATAAATGALIPDASRVASSTNLGGVGKARQRGDSFSTSTKKNSHPSETKTIVRVAAKEKGALFDPAPKPRNSKDDDGNPKRRMDKVLRTLTEAYSDRVGQLGGGAAKHGSIGKRHAASSVSGIGGVGRAGADGGGERARLKSSALVVQRAYRRRMFHRFVWAQAYLRRPKHAFGLFKRVCCSPILGAATASTTLNTDVSNRINTSTLASVSAEEHYSEHERLSNCYTGIDKTTTANTRFASAPSQHEEDGKFVRRRASGPGAELTLTSIDAWPEPLGFSPVAPHHAHAADAAFLEYVRWCRRREAAANGGTNQAWDDLGVSSERVPCGGVEGDASGAHGCAGGKRVGAAAKNTTQTPAQQQQQQQEKEEEQPVPTPLQHPPQGAGLFERKHVVRTAAVRSLLQDLRLPFAPGALDSAMEDLECAIASANTNTVTSERTHQSDVRLSPGRGGRNQSKGGRGGGGGRGGLSFVCWYDWWVRHLPYDPASPTCLLKTVRCARGLHSAEIAIAAGGL